MHSSPPSPERVNNATNGHEIPRCPTSPVIMDTFDFSRPSLGGPVDLPSPARADKFGRPSVLQERDENTLCSSTHSSPTKKSTQGHIRTNSDVLGIVAKFNSLDITQPADGRKKDTAALRRAQMGREEAEGEVKRLKAALTEALEATEKEKQARDEVRRLKKEVDEGKDRERRVMKRLDMMMEELHQSKENQAHAQNIFQKELRKAKKEAFRSSSALLKMQEELKISRKAVDKCQVDLDSMRRRCSAKEQEAFTAQYQVVGLQEQLCQTQARIKLIEEERDALRTSLKEEEVSRIAAEGRIPLPTSPAQDDEFASPKKGRRKPSLEQHVPPPAYKAQFELEQLQCQLDSERMKKEAAESQVEFMKMECHFQCCSCRIAEKSHYGAAYDDAFQAEIARIKAEIERDTTPIRDFGDSKANGMVASPDTRTFIYEDSAKEGEGEEEAGAADVGDEKQAIDSEMENTCAESLTDPTTYIETLEDDKENTDSSRPSQKISVVEAETTRTAKHLPLHIDTDFQVSESDVLCAHYEQDSPSPVKNADVSVRAVTTITTVPLQDVSNNSKYSAFITPNTPLTREEAIEQLRIRRGRARSAQGTPAKAFTPNPRRDISEPMAANAGRTPKTDGRAR